jgi:hypothetical protein
MEKQRNPLVNSVIQEIENEFTKKANDNPSTLLLTEKFKQFIELIENKTKEKCSSQISEFEKYAKLEMNGGNVNVVKVPGKEREADAALAELERCQTPIASYYMAINTFSTYNASLIGVATDFCFDDCEKKVSPNNREDMTKCIRSCYDYSFNFTLRGIEELMLQQLDSAKQELQKL